MHLYRCMPVPAQNDKLEIVCRHIVCIITRRIGASRVTWAGQAVIDVREAFVIYDS